VKRRDSRTAATEPHPIQIAAPRGPAGAGRAVSIIVPDLCFGLDFPGYLIVYCVHGESD
jgi:hypothetical protein